MSEDKVFPDEPWLSISWDSANACVRSEWKAFANSAEFRAGLVKALEAIRETNAVSYVTDTRKIKVIVAEDTKWAGETLAKQAVALGLRRLAFVTAEAGLGQAIVGDIVRRIDDKQLTTHTFGSLEAALVWIAARRPLNVEET